MGSPGCGKTTAAAAVGHRLGMTVVDVDDYLENVWKTSVAAKVLSKQLCTCPSVNHTLCLEKTPIKNYCFLIYSV